MFEDHSWAMVSSFGTEGGRPGTNPEAGLITQDSAEVQAITEQFDCMWESSQPLLAQDEQSYRDHERFFTFKEEPVNLDRDSYQSFAQKETTRHSGRYTTLQAWIPQ